MYRPYKHLFHEVIPCQKIIAQVAENPVLGARKTKFFFGSAVAARNTALVMHCQKNTPILLPVLEAL